MKRLWPVLTTAFVLVSAVPAVAQPESWVRGTVSGMAGDSITIKAAGQDMKIMVTPKTAVVARGAGTASEEAEEAGKTGVALGQFLKVGDRAEVRYTEAGGTMTAVRIRTGSIGGDAKSGGEKGRIAQGTVSAVDGTSVTVMAGGQAMKFMVDGATRFIGRGLGTKQAAGAKLTATDAVGKGDTVSVQYHDQGGIMHAAEVRITRKAGAS